MGGLQGYSLKNKKIKEGNQGYVQSTEAESDKKKVLPGELKELIESIPCEGSSQEDPKGTEGGGF